tara:strand:+ start:177 stop:428 length:252 start_codon:yes stop_codon:yes gene_type:complete
MKCANCSREIIPEPISGWDQGHNGVPLIDGRVCTACNEFVIVLRIKALRDRRRNTTEHPDYLKPLVDCERFGAKDETDNEVGT